MWEVQCTATDKIGIKVGHLAPQACFTIYKIMAGHRGGDGLVVLSLNYSSKNSANVLGTRVRIPPRQMVEFEFNKKYLELIY